VKLLQLLDELAVTGENVWPVDIFRQAAELVDWDDPYIFMEEFTWQLIGNVTPITCRYVC